MTLAHRGLAKHSVGTAGLGLLAVSASAPMTVLVGGIISSYAATGVVGVPLSFLVLGGALALFAVGYIAMSRDVPNAASFYAFLALGIGRSAGVAGAVVALIAYNAIQISLYGLFGATLSAFLGGNWWVWALVGWLVIAILGILHIQVNTRLLAAVLAVELLIIAMFDIAGFLAPAEGRLDFAPLMPNSLVTDGLGGVLAFGVAAFIGFETVTVYREEAPTHDAIVRACFGTLAFLSIFYAVSGWAMAMATGPDNVVDAARSASSELPFTVLDSYYGPFVSVVGQVLLVTGVFASLLSFHNVVARYIYGLARERILPSRLRAIGGTSGGVPIAGSIAQSITALATVVFFAALGADPLAALFTWLSTLAALGVLGLMVASSIAVVRFYRTREHRPPAWKRVVAPIAGAVSLMCILAITIVNIDSLTNSGSETALKWILPLIVIVAASVGLLWAARLHHRQPGVYATIGRGEPKPLAVLERALADLEV